MTVNRQKFSKQNVNANIDANELRQSIYTASAALDKEQFSSLAEQVLPQSLCNKAQETITKWNNYKPTTLHNLTNLAEHYGLGSVYCKDEGERFGLGSFKALGGAYAASVLASRKSDLTIACATEGNHGRSVAWGAREAGMECVIFLHENVSQAREDAIAKYGARIIRVSGSYDDAVRKCTEVSEENGWQVVSDTSWEGYSEIPTLVMAGYSLIAKEVLEQINIAPTHVFLQAGVGGFAAAVMASASRYWPGQNIKYIIVEPESAACLVASLHNNGQMVSINGPFKTVTAGLACGEPSGDVLPLIHAGTSMALPLPDSAFKQAMRQYAKPYGDDPAIVSGASGSGGMAGLLAALTNPVLKQELGLDINSHVLLINTENATDPEAYELCVGIPADDL